jgi:DMSO/TMAO reductase YedYZ molybdopterin-dependent catalytic subunit
MDSPPGPFRAQFWRSPLRGPWLASILGSALLPLIVICAVTGFLSQAAYDPSLSDNSQLPGGGLGFDLYFFSWPTSPSWIYAFTQGLHVISGVAAIPLLLAKLWSAMPKLFEWPPVRSLAHGLERASLAFLVGGSIFVFFTGLLNIQLYYPWSFSFVPAHYYGAFIFLGALALHVTLKLPVIRKAFRDRGVLRPLRDDLAHTRPEPPEYDSTAPANPTAPTMSRRALLGTVAAGSAGLGAMAAGQVIGGPLRDLALLAPRGQKLGDGPNDFQINKTARAAGINAAQTGPDWRLVLQGTERVELSRPELMEMAKHSHDLTIGCVEGWSTTQRWTGVRLKDLASLAGAPEGSDVEVSSLQRSGGFNHAVLSSGQIGDDRSMLALKVNGADLSLDHGYPARVIVPGAPGVHDTKWVASMTFREAPPPRPPARARRH